MSATIGRSEMIRRDAARAIGAFAGSVAALALFATASFAQSGSGTSAGYCLAFDGVDDLVHVLRSPSLEPDTITVEMWARLDGPQDWNTRLLRKCGHWSDGYYLSADADNDQRMQLMVSKSPPLLQVKDPKPHTAYIGGWHYFAGVYGLDFAEFWVDGIRVTTLQHTLGAMTHLPLTDLYIGAGLPSTQPSEFFSGRIDEVRVWNYARGHAEMAAKWNRTLTGAESGLVAYWRFDEGAGQVAHDSSFNGNDGELGLSPDADASDPTWVVSDAPLDIDCSSIVANYCIGAINSTGKAAQIGWYGSTNITANAFMLTATNCPPNKSGVFFMGSYQTQIPFGEGYLCVTGNQHRFTPVVHCDATGSASYTLDFSDPNSPASLIAAGVPWNFQLWYRDPQPVGHGFNFTDALAAQFCP